MWSDNDIDNAFQRLNPPEPEPTSFPLDAWLRLETQLDKAVIARAVRRKLWKFFAAEIAVVALLALGWLLWPAGAAAPAVTTAGPSATSNSGAAVADAGKANERGLKTVTPAQTTVAVAAPATVATAPTAPASADQSSDSKAPTPQGLGPAVAPHAPAATAASPLLAAVSSDASRKQRGNPRQAVAAENRMARGAFAAGFADAPTARKATRLAKEQAIRRSRTVAASALTTVTTETPEPSAAAARRAIAAPASPHGRSLRKAIVSSANANGQELRDGAMTEAAGAIIDNATGKTLDLAVGRTAPAADLTELSLRPVALLPVAPTPLHSVTAEPVATPAPVAPVRQPRLYVGLVGAPDVTTVKFASVQSPMPNVGITLEYRLTNRLRVTTGLLRSTKAYTARREDYDFGAYTARVYQRNFEDVDGACTVLDVPLNLRYEWAVGPQHKFFGSAGLSSFFMQREEYSYVWVENNKLNRWEGSAMNQNRHLFSILNLSAGYERSLGRCWSVQAEPYVKLPLAGVGLGKVKLISAGVFLGVKYGF